MSSQSLQGKRILVTRTREQASTFSEKLRVLGAQPIEFPTIRIVSPTDWSELDTALRNLYASSGSKYDWLILTSVNGVSICCQRLLELGIQPQSLQGVRIATIGPATAAALAHYGLSADLVPSEYVAEGVLAILHADAQQRNEPLKGQRILLARAAEARKVLVTELQEAGAIVHEVPAYYTLPVAHDDKRGQDILQLLQQQQLDYLTFTSSSTVRNFVEWLKSCEQESGVSLRETLLTTTQLASIGPITSQTARELGLRVDIEAQEFTIDGLVNAINEHEEKHDREHNHIAH